MRYMTGEFARIDFGSWDHPAPALCGVPDATVDEQLDTVFRRTPDILEGGHVSRPVVEMHCLGERLPAPALTHLRECPHCSRRLRTARTATRRLLGRYLVGDRRRRSHMR